MSTFSGISFLKSTSDRQSGYLMSMQWKFHLCGDGLLVFKSCSYLNIKKSLHKHDDITQLTSWQWLLLTCKWKLHKIEFKHSKSKNMPGTRVPLFINRYLPARISLLYAYASLAELELKREWSPERLSIINGMHFLKFSCSVCAAPHNCERKMN